MTFQPLIPTTGIAGLRFIERTQEAQLAVFNKSPLLVREIEYFKENIGNALTADALTDDYLLRKVALGAFGLEEDLPKKFFINKILSEGTDDPEAFANRLVDARYGKLAEAFGYGNALGTNVLQSDFAQKIITAYQTQKFEEAVGETDNSIRLALNFKREIQSLSDPQVPVDTAWYQIMGNKPLRTVFETAFGLPTSVGALDVERQLEIFKDKAQVLFGDASPSVFIDPENTDKILTNYMVRAQLSGQSSTTAQGNGALAILQNSAIGPSGSANLLLSRL